MSDFKSKIKISGLLLLILFLSTDCLGRGGNNNITNSSGYSICTSDDAQSKRWGVYLYGALTQKAKDKSIFSFQKERKGCAKIYVELSETLPHDYYIQREGNGICNNLTLKAKDDKTMQWLLHQYISCLCEKEDRIDCKNTYPAIIDFTTGYYDLAFEYREAFFAPNMQTDNSAVLGSHNLERDWAIWGHNLGKILSDNGSNDIYAKDGRWIEPEQFCFSNNETYSQIKDYILQNYPDDTDAPTHFMIMPNDNMIACLCPQCKTLGNTKGHATPAVASLIKRLAQDFPGHIFFTSAYLTTNIPYDGKLPENTGIMISTINLPKGIALTNQNEVKTFLHQLNEWRKCTDRIYIWDYASNFDDYLTPLPILYGLQQQLQFYKSNGIKGVFLNASGYDYSTFDDMKTFVASALMANCSLAVDDLCYKYFSKMYPVSGQTLGEYYLSMEKRFSEKGKPYNIYGSFQEAMSKYIDMEDFIRFYDAVNSARNIAEGSEKQNLDKLYTALSFTRLQLAHTQGIKKYGHCHLRDKTLELRPEIKEIHKQLAEYTNYDNLTSYKEVRGDLKYYLDNWQQFLDRLPIEDRLIDEPIKALSKLDEDYDIRMLNDGTFGFYGDYHMGWHLSSVSDLHIEFPAKNLKDVTTLSLRFLVDERHKIFSPQKIDIHKDGKLYKTVHPGNPGKSDPLRVDSANIEIDISDAELVSVKIYRPHTNDKSILACDEFLLY